MRDGDILKINNNQIQSLKKNLKIKFENNSNSLDPYNKGNFQHYMLKEIHEQPIVLKETQKYIDEFFIDFKSKFKSIFQVDKIVLVGCELLPCLYGGLNITSMNTQL